MRIKRSFLAVLLSLEFCSLVPFTSFTSHAQVAGAAIAGTVTDSSGAVLVHAQVLIQNTATGVTARTRTNSNGLYSVPNLIPGPYQISVTQQGFQTVVRSGITLTVGAQVTLNIPMTVGEEAQTVVVKGEASTVQLTSSSLSGVVGDQEVRELPLNGRDWTTLAALQPGVVNTASIQQSNDIVGFARGNRGLGVQMGVSGLRPQLNNYRIDGITVNDYVNGGPGSVNGGTLGVDAIKEFSVITSSSTAEYGRTAGGVINAITNSGTNQFHGDVFEFLRNSALDAANYFDDFSHLPKAPFRQNQFGVAAGGPIRKDRTFFFGNYEGFRRFTSTTVLAIVPSSSARSGILNYAGGPSTYPSGCTQTANPNQCSITVSPLVTPYLPLWALPNAGLLADGNTGLFAFPGKQNGTENFGTVRIDQTFSSKDSIFGSFEIDRGELTLPDSANDTLNPNYSSRLLIPVEETHVFSPSLVNTFRVGFSRTYAATGIATAVNPLAADLSLGPATGFGSPIILVAGLAQANGIGSVSQHVFPYNSYQLYDDAFVTRGKHDIKFGGGIEYDQLNDTFTYAEAGEFTFASLFNFLIDQPQSSKNEIPGANSPYGWRQTIYGTYVQDDIHMSPKLTFNVGLRYETATVLNEIHNKLSALHNLSDPTPTLGRPLMSNPTHLNFAPRLGFAWDPFGDGKTSIRGAFGMFDILPLLSQIAYKGSQAGPFNEQASGKNLPQGSFPATGFASNVASAHLRTMYLEQKPKRDYTMTWNLNIQRDLKRNLTATVAYVGSRGVHQPFAGEDFNIVLPTKTSIGYLWPYPVGSGTTVNTSKHVGRIDGLLWTNSTNYNGLETRLVGEIRHNLTLQGAFTWSRAIDDGDGISIGDEFANSITNWYWFDPKLRRGPSDFNVAKNFVLSYRWVVPENKALHGPAGWVSNGWELGGIFQDSAGEPFSPNLAGSGTGPGGDPLGEGSTNPFDFPNRIKTGPCRTGVNKGSVTNYINLNCYTLPSAPSSFSSECAPWPGAVTAPPAGQVYCSNLLGNSSRNSVYGPGLVNLDFAVFKNNHVTALSENLNVQFRAEVFNISNHPNFLSPLDNSNIFDVTGAPVPGAGLIDSTSNSAREVQFAVKVIW